MKRVYLYFYLFIAPPAQINSSAGHLDHAGEGLLDLLTNKKRGRERKERKREKERRDRASSALAGLFLPFAKA